MTTTNMPTNKNNPFLDFLKIFAETGNPNHADLESGWEENPDQQPPETEINLSTTPKEKHHTYIYHDITIPPAINQYIAASDTQLTQHEINNLEIGMEKYHQIDTIKHCITWQAALNKFILLENVQ
jgi:hypothetical protein